MGILRFPAVRTGRARKARHIAVVVLVAFIGGLSFAGQIKLDQNKIPPAKGTYKRFKLSPSQAPTDFVKQVLANVAPGKNLESLGNSSFAKQHGIKSSEDVDAAVDNDKVIAIIDKRNGNADVFPDLDKLPPMAMTHAGDKEMPPIPKNQADAAKKAAEDVISKGVFGHDASKPVLEDMLTLNAAQFNRSPKGDEMMNTQKSGPILATFPVKRLIGNMPVFGEGSHGVINVAANGKVHGFSKHWQTASDNDSVTEDRTPGQIADLIKAELADLAAKGDVEVLDVKLGYYDGDKGYLQPVIKFDAKVSITPMSGGRKETDDDFVVGYIPIGSTLEPIPSLLNKAENPPAVPPGAPTNLPLSELWPSEPPEITGEDPAAVRIAQADVDPEIAAADPTVGRYVVRNDYAGWVNSANGFWNGLQASGYGAYFTNKQYYWAYPFEFQGSKNSYINAVNVAEIEVHGDWWNWSTYQNWGDIVSVDSIPAPGLGGSAGGSAAYFIIHSCEVVPSAADTSSWPTKWWHVFGGLHSVLGYRTIMYIDDGVMYNFGKHMGWGSNLTSSWLNDVVASSYYWSGSGQVMHGVWKPYGRPSTISVCGHEGDSVYYTANIGAATCLTNYWYY